MKVTKLSAFEKRLPQPAPPSPLTEEDEKTHDEGQGSEDQASFADGLIVLEKRGRERWCGWPFHSHGDRGARKGHVAWTQG
jgi:hypothetical protein